MTGRIFASVGAIALSFGLSAQNITDLDVANNKSADKVMAGVRASAIPDSVFLHPDRIKYDDRCFQIEGNDVFIMSGTFHYFRTPRPLWEDRIVKMKDAGFNCIETYVPWNWHERAMPKSPNDFSCLDMSELEDFMALARKYGFYVILRPGPYICAEWSGGGFPQWIMRKKPKNTVYEVWLQSNDPEFVKWNEHWYRAVCEVAAPYQITRNAPGEGGIILFQIENEFNRINWFKKEDKKDYLEKLAVMARKYGIDVPLVSCWTSESRNVENGPLCGVLDMVNSYPKWNIDKSLGRLVNLQLSTQPGKPLLSGELQGGWMSEVGGRLSWDQDGLMPTQTQNIALYALQRGFCGINFYMLVGGSNFDDWGARGMTQTYDYAAAIGEDGSLNDRYFRLKSLAPFMKEHGAKIARANLTEAPAVYTDSAVNVTVRQAENGDRYFFVRTEDRSRPHFGKMAVDGISFDFELEPFGSKVMYLPVGQSVGEWYPQRSSVAQVSAYGGVDTIAGELISFSDPLPKKWKKIKAGSYIDRDGIYGRHPVYYRTQAPVGRVLEVGRIGRNVVNRSDKDDVVAMVNGRLLPVVNEQKESVSFLLPGDSASKGRCEVILLFGSQGLHHHTNLQVERHWGIGLDYVRCDGSDLPLEYAYAEKDKGIAISSGQSIGEGGTNPLLTWHRLVFSLEKSTKAKLLMAGGGNGYIYLNGKCLGPYNEKGPQYEFWLPECWFNQEGENIVAVSNYPAASNASLRIEVICEK